MTDADFLKIACQHAAANSDDPRTQVGAVLVQGDLFFCEANRIPDGVSKDPSRLSGESKYKYIEHAERGVIYRAAAAGIQVARSKLYCPWFACPDCARAMICGGVSEVVGLISLRNATPPRWESEIQIAEQMLSEAGVSMRWIADRVGETILFDGKTFSC